MAIEEKIKIAFGMKPVSVNLTYQERADLLMVYAQRMGAGRRIEGYSDDKCLITENGIEALLESGGIIIKLNVMQNDNEYCHRVLYKEHQFLAITK